MKTSAKSGGTRRMGWRGLLGGSMMWAVTVLLGCQGTVEDAGAVGATSGAQSLAAAASIAPTLKWAWTGSAVLPDYKQVMTTPVVITSLRLS